MIHPNSALKTASPLSCREQNSQLSWIRNPGSDGQTLAAEADFLPAPNPISLTDFSYFPDWFATEHFHQQAEGSEVCRGQALELKLTLQWLSRVAQYHLWLWAILATLCHFSPEVSPWKMLKNESVLAADWRHHKLTPSHHLSASWNCSNVPVKYWSCEIVKH